MQTKLGTDVHENTSAKSRFTVSVLAGSILVSLVVEKKNTLHRKLSARFPLKKTRADTQATKSIQHHCPPLKHTHTHTHKVIKQQKVSTWVWDIKSKKETKGPNDFLFLSSKIFSPNCWAYSQLYIGHSAFGAHTNKTSLNVFIQEQVRGGSSRRTWGQPENLSLWTCPEPEELLQGGNTSPACCAVLKTSYCTPCTTVLQWFGHGNT